MTIVAIIVEQASILYML